MKIIELICFAGKMLSEEGIDTAYLDAEILMRHALGCKREELFLLSNEILDQEKIDYFMNLIERRKKREPVAYITEKKEFFSREFIVSQEVMIPRPETETLVERVIDIIRLNNIKNMLDIGTGSGIIAITLSLNFPELKICATDISDDALNVARKNAIMHGVESRIEFVKSDLFDGLDPEKKFDLIVSNPPYIPSRDIPLLDPEIRDYEPRVAIDGGLDGLDVIRRIARDSHNYMQKGGFLVMEVGEGQGPSVLEILRGSNYSDCMIFKDLSGKERCIVSRKADG